MSTTQARQVNPWAALFALCIGFFMIMLDTTIVSVAIPAMLTHLKASLNQIVWVTSVYLLTFAVPLLITGRLGDRIGRKTMFLSGLAVFTLSSLWCALSGNADMLITARAVQGLGASMLTPQTMAFITNLFPPAKRGAAMGAWGGVAGLATIAGPLLGGVLVDNFGWQWIFMVNVPIGVVGLILTVLLVPGHQQRTTHRFDVLGTVLSSLGLLALVFGLQNGQQYHWGRVFGPVDIFELIGAGVVLLALFVYSQHRNRHEPLVPLSLFRHRTFASANVANVMIGFALTGMFLPLVIYFQSVRGLSPLMSGVVTAPMSLLSGIVAPLAGRLSDRISGKYVAMTGFLALAVGITVIVLQARWDTPPAALIPALLLCGLGVGCVFSPLANLATSDVPLRSIGAASGVFNMFRQVGGVLGSAAIGVLLQARLSVSMHAAALTQAAALPPAYRAEFVTGLTNAAGSSSEFGASSAPALPPGVPVSAATQIGALAKSAFQHGFTDATRATLILPAVMLAIGALACLPMARRVRLPELPGTPPTDAEEQIAARAGLSPAPTSTSSPSDTDR